MTLTMFARPLKPLWRRGFRFLIVLDIVALFTTMVIINIVRFGFDWPTYPSKQYFFGFGVATSIHIVVNYLSGLYEREPVLGTRPWLPRVAASMIIATGMDGLVTVIADRYLMPRINLAALLVVGTAALTATRQLSRFLSIERNGAPRIAIVGSENERNVVRQSLSGEHSPFLILAEVDEVADLLVSESLSQISDVLVLDFVRTSHAYPTHITELRRLKIRVHQRISSLETLLGLRAVRQVVGMPFVPLRLDALAPHQHRLKRSFDIGVVCVTFPIWLPLITTLYLYVRLVAGKQPIFRQQRVGQWGKPFTMIKFRTMIHDAEADGVPRLSVTGDPRVIKSLGWLRTTRLDELPQIFNVISGDMSLVGPRPERPELVEHIEISIDGYSRRHEIKPGMTGLAQVEGRYDSDAAHKLGYDAQYLANWTILLDLQIVLRTLFVVLTRRI